MILCCKTEDYIKLQQVVCVCVCVVARVLLVYFD